MLLYIYDSFLKEKKYQKALKEIENRITRLALSGAVARVNITKKNFYQIENAIKKGVTTIVAVGNDSTVNQVVNILASLDCLGCSINKIVLGIIPIGKNNIIANNLGIENEITACDIIAQRRLAKLDLGVVNNTIYFVSRVNFFKKNITLNIGRGYSLGVGPNHDIQIINLGTENILDEKEMPLSKSGPQDGKLELVIKKNKKGLWGSRKDAFSYVPFKKLTISGYDYPIILDGSLQVDIPVEISAVKKYLDVIVGKERNF